MLNHFRRLLGDNKGVTAIEYTLIAALVRVASITAYRTIGNSVGNTLNSISTTIAGTLAAPTTGGGRGGGGSAPGTNWGRSAAQHASRTRLSRRVLPGTDGDRSPARGLDA